MADRYHHQKEALARFYAEQMSAGFGPAVTRKLGWTIRDYAIRVWDNSGEDNVLFLAGGIAFNLILAAVPFILLLAAGVAKLLPLLYRGALPDSTSTVSIMFSPKTWMPSYSLNAVSTGPATRFTSGLP